MQIPRIYQNIPIDQMVQLDAQAFAHVVKVLRLVSNDRLILFNGDSHEYHGELEIKDKRTALVRIKQKILHSRESNLHIHLAQGIARGAKMDLIIQKAVELGVNEITPIFTARCNVKLEQERGEKRLNHWQSVAISAAEQCGRNRITLIHPPVDLSAYFEKIPANAQRLVLSHRASQRIKDLSLQTQSIILLIGPEGGLAPQELHTAELNKFTPIVLGPRILRTETAALVAVSVLQAQLGDY